MKTRMFSAVGASVLMAAAGFAGPAFAGGANQGMEGPFYNDCQTSDTCLPSGNGQGMAKPAAGSKGKADVKSPPGQGLEDKNNGYECDGNNGIAKGNPAHTGCSSFPV